MTEFYQKEWMKLWHSNGYQTKKRAGFDALDNYLPQAPVRILDIGCGLAWESQLFNEKYNTELWLLDGDVSSNKNKDPEKSNWGKWHDKPDTLLFYHSLDVIDQHLKEAKVSNYHLIDTNNINIPEDIKFDVITSWLSCGFHYPVSTYKDLILKHSHENTVIAMDLRLNKHTKLPTIEPGMELVNHIRYGKKHVNSHIRFL